MPDRSVSWKSHRGTRGGRGRRSGRRAWTDAVLVEIIAPDRGSAAVLVDLVGSSHPLEIVATESSWVVRSFLVPRSFAAVAGTSFARHRRATMPPRCRSERSRDGTGFHGLLVGWRGALISGVPAWALWTILAAVFAIGEVLTPGLFFLGPLALAALIAAVVAFAAGGAPGAIAFVAASVAIAPHCRLVASARRDAHGNGYVEFPSCPAMGPAGRPDGCSTPAAANASSDLLRTIDAGRARAARDRGTGDVAGARSRMLAPSRGLPQPLLEARQKSQRRAGRRGTPGVLQQVAADRSRRRRSGSPSRPG